jgi:hypothetical protein
VNPVLAKAYERVAIRDLSEEQPDPDHAIQALNNLEQKDSGNALRHYVLAAAYARGGDWDAVTRELKRGNGSSYCIHYQFNAGPDHYTPAFVSLRQLARACAAGAADLEVRPATALLREARRMGKKVTATEPRSVIALLLGPTLRMMADRGLVEYLEARGASGLAEAKKVQAADVQFRAKMIADLNARIEDPQAVLQSLAKKHGVSLHEMDTYSRGGAVSAAAKQKLATIAREADARELPLVKRWSQAMPD